MPKRGKIPSEAQAKRLAGLFSDSNRSVADGDSYISPTDKAILKNGWVEDTGKLGAYANGRIYKKCAINAAGLLALECFLSELRYRASSLSGDERNG